tara:strand:- start:1498 stop:1827 length:330 start_codon:yes stop_codon:yes gene_type:complete
MYIKPYRELSKHEKMIVKYEDKLSDFRDQLGIDLMEYIDSDWQKTTGEFFPMEESEILEDNQVRKYIFAMHQRLGVDYNSWDIDDLSDDTIFWNNYQLLLEYLENKYCQ